MEGEHFGVAATPFLKLISHFLGAGEQHVQNFGFVVEDLKMESKLTFYKWRRALWCLPRFQNRNYFQNGGGDTRRQRLQFKISKIER